MHLVVITDLHIAAAPKTDPNTEPAKNGKPSRTDPAAGSPVDPSMNGPEITIYVYAEAPVVTCVTPTPKPSGTPPVTPTPTPSCSTSGSTSAATGATPSA